MNILMYHSISHGPPPLCLSLNTFRRHMDALVARGMRGVSLASHLGQPQLDTVVLTFDDGFVDNFEVVAPELASRGFSATLFLACDMIDSGRHPCVDSVRLMGWDEAASLHKAGWEVGSHACTHHNLTRLPWEECQREIGQSQQRLQAQLGVPIPHFAAPFGATNSRVREAISTCYQAAVGTRLGLMESHSDRFDLPRLEMFYFRDPARFEAHLDGRGGAYLGLRKLLRAAGQALNWGSK
ncbi:polysaccharide deacetylase family protein [bacterium]|nr:polysaccharide deacetylase family protein [bacterium]